MVQVNQTLHARTINEVRKVTKVSDPVDVPHAAGSQAPDELRAASRPATASVRSEARFDAHAPQ
jgi:hypothetical protein